MCPARGKATPSQHCGGWRKQQSIQQGARVDDADNSGTRSGGAEGSTRPAPPRHPWNRVPPHPRNRRDLDRAAHQRVRGGPEDAPPQEDSAPQVLPVWDGSVGSTNPPLFLRNISNIWLLPPAPLLSDSEVELLKLVAAPRKISDCAWQGRRVVRQHHGDVSMCSPLVWARRCSSAPPPPSGARPPSGADGQRAQSTGRRGAQQWWMRACAKG
jgi:hypothetical protein